MKTFISDLSNSEFPIGEKVAGTSIRPSILKLIQSDHPGFTEQQCISLSELYVYREKYIELFMKRQVGKITVLEKKVMSSLKEKKAISEGTDKESNLTLTFGQRVADRIADFGGSWTFILSFLFFLLAWICMNVFWLANRSFDPYPFILLNLILSTLAAFQAPVIMMSQNRQGEKDRDRAQKDYMVNLKAELEIGMLQEKVDHLIINEQQEVLEIHKTQLNLLSEILKKIEELEKK